MAGMLVPLVLFPRFTTLTGNTTFSTIGMDVTEYEQAIVSFWRSSGISPGVPLIDFEESTDQTNWTDCGGGPFADPGANTEGQFQPELTKRWFRISVTLPNASSAVTLWCLGFLMQRES
jgi:hypothetical protein